MSLRGFYVEGNLVALTVYLIDITERPFSLLVMVYDSVQRSVT